MQENNFTEIIIAISRTPEGEATSRYLYDLIKSIKSFNIKISRIAYGVPFGGELEYIDPSTLANAILERTAIQ